MKTKNDKKQKTKKPADVIASVIAGMEPHTDAVKIAPEPKKPEDPRVTLVKINQRDIQKSLTGNGGKTAILQPDTVQCYANVAMGIMVWNGIGHKTRPDGTVKLQPLSGGSAFKDGSREIYKIPTLRALFGDGDAIAPAEILNR